MCIALPGRIVAILDPVRRLLRIERAGRRWDVSAEIVDDDLDVGDWVEVHSGFVLSKLTDEDARQMLAFADELVAADQQGPSDADPAAEAGPDEPGDQDAGE